ncbi:hypothetical protein NDA14_007473 [Ustilago hordei]|nr:hypothetical protein NDA14_007473 [Ustilago hordei]
MTRASTCAANFGLLLIALVLLLDSVVGKLIPKHVNHHVFARQDSIDQCFLTKLDVNEKGYKDLCEGDKNPTHPCFTHWYGNLHDVDARPFLEPFDITQNLMIKDDKRTDSFVIRYPNLGGVYFVCSNIDPETGCKDITLKRGDNTAWRIWISDEKDNNRDLDTFAKETTTGRFCTKWIHIHIKKDG